MAVNDNDWMKKWQWKRGAGCVWFPVLLGALVFMSISMMPTMPAP